MMHLRRYLLAVLPLLGSLARVPVAFATPIAKIEVQGLRRIEADAIKERMKMKEGAEPTSEKVRDDILAIFALGWFEDVRMDQDGDKLIVTVRERPVVTEIKYEGSDEFETKDLEEATGLKPFNVVNLAKIRAAQQALSKKYEEKGYYLARADYELRPIPAKPNEVLLAFKITENEKVRIRKVFFLGNKIFTSSELKKIMITTEGHVFSWMTNGGTYREGAFERDLNVLAFFYGNEGYIEAKFAKPRVTLSQDRRYVDIFIDVEEGKQFNLGDITFKGELLFSQDELRKSFEMKQGDTFSTGKLQEEVLKLTDKYGDEGYAFANVIPRPQTREGTNIVDLNFEVEKGEKVYWGKISVTGNTKTHDKVIRRELPFFEGELYNATKRKKGLEKVRRLGFFGNDVNFLTSTPPGSTNIQNLEIRVAEKPTGSLNVSAGWGSAQKFVFGAQVSQNNLMGLGQQLQFNLQWVQTGAKTFNLGFTDPHFMNTEWLGGADLYRQISPVGYSPMSYESDVSGGDLNIGRELRENFWLKETYKLEYAHLTKAINDAAGTSIFTSAADKNSVISSLTTTASYDSRNNRLDPSGGEYLSASAEFAGLGGRVFQKYVGWARLYRRLGWRFVYRTNVEYGVITNGFSSETVPDSERFVLGGVFSLRGYDQSSIGTSREVANLRTNENGVREDSDPPGKDNLYRIIIGGTHKLVINQEIEFPLIPDADIRAVFFFDAGTSWDNKGDLKPAILTDLGWGIRWYSPLGPLRFEWGYPLHRIPTSPSSPAFQFIIAPTF